MTRLPVTFNPTDPAFLQNPYPTYQRLRDEAPILFYEPWNKWIVTRHSDVGALLRDRRLGRVLTNVKVRVNPEHAAFDDIQDGSLLELEPPDHTRIKAAVQDVFTPKHVRALEAKIAALCDRLAARLSAQLASNPDRRADLLTDYAEPIPVTVIAELLGVPERERYRLVPWSRAIIGMFEPERTLAMEKEAVTAAGEFAGYVRELIHEKRADPQDDLVSRMVGLHDADPERLSEPEIVANAILFLDAGHEAVVNVVGNGMVALLSRPDVWERLKAHPEHLETAVEEALRFDTPLQFFERVVREDLEYGSFFWPRGTRLCLYYASSNRDERVFRDPDTFDLTRDPNPHLSFGLGLHYCIGAPLARLELKHALRALTGHVPDIKLAGTTVYQPKNVFRYPTVVQVTY